MNKERCDVEKWIVLDAQRCVTLLELLVRAAQKCETFLKLEDQVATGV